MVGNASGRPSRPLLLAIALGLCLFGLAGCGDDDDEGRAPAESAPGQAETRPEAGETVAETEGATDTDGATEIDGAAETERGETEAGEPEGGPAPSPEDQPGGAGDEQPARSLALFSARRGRITPRVIRVPAFISIRIELRSADGRAYGLRFPGKTIRVGRRLESVSTTVAGLRPGRALVGRPTGAGNRVRVEATAEPGP